MVVEDIIWYIYDNIGASSVIKGGAPTHLHQRGAHSLMEGVSCHLDEVVRRGGVFPNQVGYLMRGGSLPSHEFKSPSTILSTTRTTSSLGIMPPWSLGCFLAINARHFSSFRRMSLIYAHYIVFISYFINNIKGFGF